MLARSTLCLDVCIYRPPLGAFSLEHLPDTQTWPWVSGRESSSGGTSPKPLHPHWSNLFPEPSQPRSHWNLRASFVPPVPLRQLTVLSMKSCYSDRWGSSCPNLILTDKEGGHRNLGRSHPARCGKEGL